MSEKKAKWGWHIPVLILIMMLSAVLNFYNLNQEGYGNTYYAAAVKSMMSSWHNFFFVSFDPGGFITIDKPPVDFWLQTLSAIIFGFKGWALLLPQALAAVISVGLIDKLVAKVYGRIAGLLAALVLAVTPILVAVSRTNNVDGMLVLALIIATWFLSKSVERGQLKYLLLTAVMVGIGFNIKMMEAYLVLPAFFVLYVIAPPISWKKKVAHLAAATVVLLVVSFSWSVIVDSIPADQRPYVGSSQTNSEVELSLGYNGVQRFTGRGGMPGGRINGDTRGDRGTRSFDGQGNGQGNGQRFGQGQQNGFTPPNGTSAQNGTAPQNGWNPQNGWTPPNGMQPPNGAPSFGDRTRRDGRNGGGNPFADGGRGGMGGFGNFGTGQAGPLRLFGQSMAGQISWLLPLVGFALVALIWRPREERVAWLRQRKYAIFYGAWLLPMMIFFSYAGFFHTYYMSTMAPGIAALAGAGLVTLWKDLRHPSWRRWLLPLAVLVTLLFQSSILSAYTDLKSKMLPLVIILGAVSVVILLLRALGRLGNDRTPATLAIIAGLLSMLIAPTYWSATPMLYGGNETMPSAGPELQNTHMRGGMMGGGFGDEGTQNNSKLLQFLMQDYKPGTYLLATTNAQTASPIIIQTGLSVMAMGGFMGSDPALTVEQLQQMAESGQVRYFLISSMGRGNAVDQWIQQNCQVVPASKWQATSTHSSASKGAGGFMRGGRGPNGSTQLYEYVKKYDRKDAQPVEVERSFIFVYVEKNKC